jgi:hypothetical protein
VGYSIGFLTRRGWVWGEIYSRDTKWVTRRKNFSFVGMDLRRLNPVDLYPLPSLFEMMMLLCLISGYGSKKGKQHSVHSFASCLFHIFLRVIHQVSWFYRHVITLNCHTEFGQKHVGMNVYACNGVPCISNSVKWVPLSWKAILLFHLCYFVISSFLLM